MARILTDKKLCKLELHVHTISSHDSLLSKIPLLLVCKIKGINCIAITDHSIIASARTYVPFFAKHGVKVIIGEEIMTTEGEIIGLFLNKEIPPQLSPEETVEAIIGQAGLVYIPHPYDTTRAKTVISTSALNELHGKVHLMECHNGRNRNTSFSERQNEICEQFGIQKVIGSDAHTFFEIGRNYIWIKPFNSQEEFLYNLSSCECIKAKCIPLSHIITKLIKAIKMIGKGDINGLFRVIKKRR